MIIVATCGKMRFEGEADTTLPYDKGGYHREGIVEHNDSQREALNTAFENWCSAVKAIGGKDIKVRKG